MHSTALRRLFRFYGNSAEHSRNSLSLQEDEFRDDDSLSGAVCASYKSTRLFDTRL